MWERKWLLPTLPDHSPPFREIKARPKVETKAHILQNHSLLVCSLAYAHMALLSCLGMVLPTVAWNLLHQSSMDSYPLMRGILQLYLFNLPQSIYKKIYLVKSIARNLLFSLYILPNFHQMLFITYLNFNFKNIVTLSSPDSFSFSLDWQAMLSLGSWFSRKLFHFIRKEFFTGYVGLLAFRFSLFSVWLDSCLVAHFWVVLSLSFSICTF